MLKIFQILSFAFFLTTFLFGQDDNVSTSIKEEKINILDRLLRNSHGEITTDFSSNSFPINGMHKKLGLSCNDCHKEANQTEYSSAMQNSCLDCHKSYEKLAEATGGLGHNDNIHANPHYEALDCDTCHRAHKPTINMCLRCHTQDSMKQLKVK